MLFHAHGVVLRHLLLERDGVLAHRIEDAALAIDPAFFARAEEIIEQLVRQHLRRQRTVVAGPTHIPLDALAERFLRDADLNRAEARILADLRGDRLVDRRSAGAVAGERRAGGHAADRLVVSVARTARGSGLVVEAAEHVDIVAERRQRAEARREVEIRAGLARESSSARECRCR